jgi:predicted metal-dependent phosphoesterase TrpH
MIRIDLHTHSEASIDGGITPDDYAYVLKNEVFDVIAITDHNRIDFAVGLQKALGEEFIIVGEEITTTDGDIVGLYLKSEIKPGMSASETIDEIHAQGGLVYIPHPFEKARSSIQKTTLDSLKDKVDIIETHNGRSLTKKYVLEAETWAVKNNVAACASSDAHGKKGLGRTYSIINSRPTAESLVSLLGNATINSKKPPYITLLYPKINRIKNKLRGYK